MMRVWCSPVVSYSLLQPPTAWTNTHLLLLLLRLLLLLLLLSSGVRSDGPLPRPVEEAEDLHARIARAPAVARHGK